MRRKHDPELAEAIGPLWEALIPNGTDSEAEADLVRASDSESSEILVSARAKRWLQRHAGEYLVFTAI